MSEKLTIFFKFIYIYLISPQQYVQTKSNRDILYVIRIVQMKSNRYIHRFKKIICTHDQWGMKKIHFVKCERWKNSFCEM